MQTPVKTFEIENLADLFLKTEMIKVTAVPKNPAESLENLFVASLEIKYLTCKENVDVDKPAV